MPWIAKWLRVNLHASAGDMGSIPVPGRFYTPQGNSAHVPQILSLCSRACVQQPEKLLQ